MDKQQQHQQSPNNPDLTPQNSQQLITDHDNDIHNSVPAVAQQLFNIICNSRGIYIQTVQMADILFKSISKTPPTQVIAKINSIFKLFMKLRSKYVGNIITASQDDILFNVQLFHAALLTDIPIIIDAIMQYISFDFTTLNIPYDQLHLIELNNNIHPSLTSFRVTNDILSAIVDVTEYGRYESILHLINNYQLSPTIPIGQFEFWCSDPITNLFYYATKSNNIQLIEYFLPIFCNSTYIPINQLHLSISNITKHGHLHLIQQFKQDYNINLLSLQKLAFRNTFTINLLDDAVESNNTDLIDYLIEVVGCNVTENVLYSALVYCKYENAKYLIMKYNADPKSIKNPLHEAVSRYSSITPDMIDDIITTFGLTISDINKFDQLNEPLLFTLASYNNIIAMKHLITNYNADPHCIYVHDEFFGHNQVVDSILQYLLKTSYHSLSVEVIEYLYELGIDFNQEDSGQKPIQLAVQHELPFNQFKSLLEHKAIINNVEEFIRDLLPRDNPQRWSIVQYLHGTYVPTLNLNQLQIHGLPLLHYSIKSESTLCFIKYLVSLNGIEILPQYNQTSPICYASSLDTIKLLMNNGVTLTLHEWASMIASTSPSSSPDPYVLFQCYDFFQDTFGYNMQQFSLSNDTFSTFNTTPLLIWAQKFIFEYNQIKMDKSPNNTNPNFDRRIISHHSPTYIPFIIYRTMVHRYKMNVNEQVRSTKNTVFHMFAEVEQFRLIQFTLLHSYYEPNLFLVNSNNQTFFQILLHNFNKIDDDDDLIFMLDCVVESLHKHQQLKNI